MADLPIIIAGTFGRNPPSNFRVTDRKHDRVVLGWTAKTDADLRQDDLKFSSAGENFAEPASAPTQVFAHKRTVLGYKLHRGAPGFTPDGAAAGQGNCIADHTTLTPGVTDYTDFAVVGGATYEYRIATVVNDNF